MAQDEGVGASTRSGRRAGHDDPVRVAIVAAGFAMVGVVTRYAGPIFS